jgi:hypothetical protein
MGEDMAKTVIVTDAGPELVVLPPGMELPTVALRYVGDGEYIYGVPARDLTPAEAAAYAVQIAATVTATGRVLYAPVEGEE